MSGLFESSKEASVAGVREEVKEALWGRNACRLWSCIQGARGGF